MSVGDLKWRYNSGESIRSGIVVGSDGVIYFAQQSWADYNDIIALNPDGSEKWRFPVHWLSFYSGLALSNDESVVYAGSLYGGLWAVYTSSGNLKWNYTPPDDIWSGIAVDANDNIYFGDEDGRLYSLYYNGTLRWMEDYDLGFELDSQITLKGSVGYTLSYRHLLKFNLSDGSIVWARGTGGQGTGVSISDDDVIYWGDYDKIKAIYSDGVPYWEYSVNLALTANAIGSDGRLWSVDLNGANTKIVVLNPDGTFSWDYNVPSWVGSEYDTTGLGLDSHDIVYVGCQDYKVYAINSDGSFRWSYTTGGMVQSGIAFSPSEDTVYFGSDDGYLYAVVLEAPVVAAKGGSSALAGFGKILMG